MRNGILLLILMLLTFSACRSDSSAELSDVNVSLPQIDAIDSDGNQVRFDPSTKRPMIVAFFDPDSVLAWRTLAQLDQQSRLKQNISLIAVASSPIQSVAAVTISTPKKQFDISFPIIPDQDGRYLKVFQIPNCCDLLQAYDAQGILKHSIRLSEASNKLDSLIGNLSNAESDDTSKSPTSVLVEGIRIGRPGGGVGQVNVADNGLTVVNLFDEFCSECATGNRLQTVDRLNQSPRPPSKVLVVFSGTQFSDDDLENFKMLLSNDSLIRGEIEAAKPYLNNGKLMLVLDSKRNVVWQEKPGMSEEEVFAAVSQLIGS